MDTRKERRKGRQRKEAPKGAETGRKAQASGEREAKDFGQLVRLGFDVAVFAPASYQRHRL